MVILSLSCQAVGLPSEGAVLFRALLLVGCAGATPLKAFGPNTKVLLAMADEIWLSLCRIARSRRAAAALVSAWHAPAGDDGGPALPRVGDAAVDQLILDHAVHFVCLSR